MKKGQNSSKQTNAKSTPKKDSEKVEKATASALPLMAESHAAETPTRSRRNISSRIEQTNRFENIKN